MELYDITISDLFKGNIHQDELHDAIMDYLDLEQFWVSEDGNYSAEFHYGFGLLRDYLEYTVWIEMPRNTAHLTIYIDFETGQFWLNNVVQEQKFDIVGYLEQMKDFYNTVKMTKEDYLNV